MANYDVVTSGAKFEYDTQAGGYPDTHAVDDNHFIQFWADTSGDGKAQIMTVNTSTWAVSTAASLLEYDTQNGAHNASYEVESGKFLHVWGGSSDLRFSAQVMDVNTSTWAVSTAGSLLSVARRSDYNTILPVDTNHFIITSIDSTTPKSYMQVLEVNTTTWAVTTSGALFEFQTNPAGKGYSISGFKVDTNHFMYAWGRTSTDAYAQTMVVNTSTWAITTAGAIKSFDTYYDGGQLADIDTNHCIVFYSSSATEGSAVTLAVNTSTWAVTTAASELIFDTQRGDDCVVRKLDDNHFANWWMGVDQDGYCQTFEVDTSTWAITTAASWLEYDTVLKLLGSAAPVLVDSSHWIHSWRGVDSDGFLQTFNFDVPASGWAGGSVSGVAAASIASRDTVAIGSISSIDTVS